MPMNVRANENSAMTATVRTIATSFGIALLPFIVVAAYWMLTWKYGEQTTEGIVFNGAFLIYRVAIILTSASLVVYLRRRGSFRGRSSYAIMEGLVIGSVTIAALLLWDRVMSSYYLNWAEPSLVEVIYGLLIGACTAAFAEVVLAPMRRQQ